MSTHAVKTTDAKPSGAIAEVQGLYGPFIFSEKLFQKIWLRGDFDRAGTVTTDGRRVRVVHPGRWNRLGGPDFKDARLAFDDEGERVGDVELHLHAEDWVAHGHAGDQAYDGVILHVVLFPPSGSLKTKGAGDREIAVLALLPWLHHDLEEYAAEEAVAQLANRAEAHAVARLGELPAAELETLLRVHAERRWAQKMHFARLRVARLGWAEACHHTALEILGYRFNRAPMMRVAGRWPLSTWSARDGAGSDEIYASEVGAWTLQGVRPANHPRVRLRQYAGWARARPDWPSRLAALGSRLPEVGDGLGTRDVRRRYHMGALRREISSVICDDVIAGSRFDNLVCDGLLPLLAAQGFHGGPGLWKHWFPGDLPPLFSSTLRALGVFAGRTHPACHGLAQGLLGWLVDCERQTSVDGGRGA